MAKRKTQRAPRATRHGDFAGPDAQREAIEALSRNAAKANGKANTGEISDEAAGRHLQMIEAAEIEWQELRDKASQAQGIYRNRLKVAKGDGMDVDAVKLAFKIKKRTAGEFIAEHRSTGRYLRLLGASVAEPKGGQGVFDFLDVAADGTAPVAMDAELQGQHAFANSEDRENNPFQAGTENFVAWDTGFNNAMAASVRKMGGTGEAAQH